MALTGYEKPLEQFTRDELIQIASNYTVSFKTTSGQTSTAYTRLPKSKLVQIIRRDPDYIAQNPRLPKPRKGTTRNRISPILREITGMDNPDNIMIEIIDALKDSESGYTPIPGKYYTYIYYAKTPRIVYDRYPLIMAVENLSRGFIGFNFHLGDYRRYNTSDGDRMATELYQMSANEFESLRRVSYGKLIQN